MKKRIIGIYEVKQFDNDAGYCKALMDEDGSMWHYGNNYIRTLITDEYCPYGQIISADMDGYKLYFYGLSFTLIYKYEVYE